MTSKLVIGESFLALHFDFIEINIISLSLFIARFLQFLTIIIASTTEILTKMKTSDNSLYTKKELLSWINDLLQVSTSLVRLKFIQSNNCQTGLYFASSLMLLALGAFECKKSTGMLNFSIRI